MMVSFINHTIFLFMGARDDSTIYGKEFSFQRFLFVSKFLEQFARLFFSFFSFSIAPDGKEKKRN